MDKYEQMLAKLVKEIEFSFFRGKADFSNAADFFLVEPKVASDTCECGAASVGLARGSLHSSWCPWSK
jgi:hypothetical protein